MRRCIPDRKWRKVLRAIEEKKPPTDLMLNRVYEVMCGTVENANISGAIGLLQEPMVRDRLVAYFLSGATTKEIGDSLWISMEILEIFEDLYVNKQEFRHKLEIHLFAQEYVKNSDSEDCEEWIRLGLEVGPTALVFKHLHGHEDLPVDSRMITREIIQQAFHLGRLARANSVTSATSKEAFKWMGAAARIATTYDKLGMDDGSEDEAIAAIKQRKMTNTPAEANIQLDDVLN
ncbi:MAG: hypothetical protein DRJ03_07625 [Chloroflexi bacterium]|nr:MAG: hypothetical protein DRJ03_07625 [Chloroflexota bacterium]